MAIVVVVVVLLYQDFGIDIPFGQVFFPPEDQTRSLFDLGMKRDELEDEYHPFFFSLPL